MAQLNVELIVRKGTAAEWAASAYVLKAGEFGYDTTNKIVKIGDGTSTWANATVVNKDTTYEIIEGTENGTISVNGTNVKVHGLGDLAYKSTVAKTDLAGDVQTSLGKADSAVQTVADGTANGTILVDGTAVNVGGLKSAAYTESTAYATAAQGTKADNALPKADFEAFQTTNTAAIEAAKKAGDDAQADLNAYKTANDAKVNKNASDISNLQTAVKSGITFKGKVDALPATTDYSNGDLIIVEAKEYILYEEGSTKRWVELGDEGSHLTKSTADNYYMPIAGAGLTAGGTHTKITYNEKGLVTGGADLAAADIPNLPASKITSGTIADDRIASAAKWNAKQDAITADNKLSADLIDGLPTNHVTTDTEQVITATKTISSGSADSGRYSNILSSQSIKLVDNSVPQSIEVSCNKIKYEITGHNTTLEFTNSTSDSTLTIPAKTGTIATTGDIETAIAGLPSATVTDVKGEADAEGAKGITVTKEGTVYTASHKGYETGTVNVTPAGTATPYIINSITIDKGHVTGANVQSLEAALAALGTLTLNGGKADGTY